MCLQAQKLVRSKSRRTYPRLGAHWEWSVIGKSGVLSSFKAQLNSQSAFTCSNLTIEALEQVVIAGWEIG